MYCNKTVRPERKESQPQAKEYKTDKDLSWISQLEFSYWNYITDEFNRLKYFQQGILDEVTPSYVTNKHISVASPIILSSDGDCCKY